MTDQPDLFAYARRTDPETSHAAARSVRDLRGSQQDVLTALTLRSGFAVDAMQPVSDEELIDAYRNLVRAGRVRPQSDSGIRTRRKELVELGFVRDSGERGRTLSGRSTILWEVTDGPEG